MKAKKKIYNWHFWVEKWNVQIVIDDTSYLRAVKRMKEISNVGCNYWNPNARKFKFQFGQLAFKE